MRKYVLVETYKDRLGQNQVFIYIEIFESSNPFPILHLFTIYSTPPELKPELKKIPFIPSFNFSYKLEYYETFKNRMYYHTN